MSRRKSKSRKKESELLASMTPAERHRHMLKKYSHIKRQIDVANGERFESGIVSSVDTYRSPYELRVKRGRSADGKES
ncbi:hypothetical protein ACP3S8_09355 [Mixta calida]|uniref:hypothetical protein n=1 Tax=Mixta calida TaxID=665913 RepID=UPI003CE8536A